MGRFLDALVAARLSRLPVPEDVASDTPSTVEEGYAVQEALHGVLGESGLGEIVGYKIGCTTPVMQAYLDIPHPCAGGVFASTVHHGSAELRLRDFVGIGIESEAGAGIECEIGVTIGHDMGNATDHGRDTIGQYVESCWASIEIVDNRFVNFESLGVASMIADDFFNAGVVVGTPVRDWETIPLEQIEGRVLVDGVERGRGTGAMILGHPFEALAWLANMKAARGEPLKSGQMITLGSVVKTVWVDRPGTVVEIEFERLGGCSIGFDA